MRVLSVFIVISTLGVTSVAGAGAAGGGIHPRQVTDMLFELAFANRLVYTRDIVQRLSAEDAVVTVSEHFEDSKGLPLPAQIFRFAAEELLENTDDYWLSLRSLTPINFANGPISPAEERGLQYVLENPSRRFYAEERWGGRSSFVAVYPDVASVDACIACHNSHPESPRRDFKLEDVMGGVIVRLFLEE